MKKIILFLSLVFITDCLSMERGGKALKVVKKRGRVIDESSKELRRSGRKRKERVNYQLVRGDDSEESSEVEEADDANVRTKKRVASASKTLYIVCPDGKETLEGTKKQNLQRSYLRKLVGHLGYDSEAQIKKIEAHSKNQDTQVVRALANKKRITLKKWFMQCPGCKQILHNEKKRERVFFHAVFAHWFLTQLHQPELYKYAAKMFADSETGAKENYAKYKDTVLNIILFPGDDKEKSEDDELSEESMQDDVSMDIDQGLDDERVVPVSDFFLVEQLPNNSNVFSKKLP